MSADRQTLSQQVLDSLESLHKAQGRAEVVATARPVIRSLVAIVQAQRDGRHVDDSYIDTTLKAVGRWSDENHT